MRFFVQFLFSRLFFSKRDVFSATGGQAFSGRQSSNKQQGIETVTVAMGGWLVDSWLVDRRDSCPDPLGVRMLYSPVACACQEKGCCRLWLLLGFMVWFWLLFLL